MFQNEKAIKNTNDDQLNRSKYAKNLAEKLIKYKNKESLVVGLEGEWGSGKTSLLNMVQENMKKEMENKNENDDSNCNIIIIDFNPWNFSSTNDLLIDFFNSLIYELSSDKNYIKKIKEKNKYKTLVKKMRKYTSYIFPILYTKTFLTRSLKEHLLFIKSKFMDNSYKYSKQHLKTLKTEIGNELSELNLKIFIFIDDIDRLDDDEIISLFKLVRNTADFENTRYILSYDPNIVNKAFDKIQNNYGEKYVEKIIQVPLKIPAINELNKKQAFVSKMMDSIETYNLNFPEPFIVNLYEYGNLDVFFNNLREITRFINIFFFEYSNLINECNFKDFLYLSIIKFFNERIYKILLNNKNILFNFDEENQEPFFYDYPSEAREYIYKNFLKNSKNRYATYHLIEAMFPELMYEYERDYPPDIQHSLKINSMENFEKFFQLEVPDNEISNSLFEKLLLNSSNSLKFQNMICSLNSKYDLTNLINNLNYYMNNIEKNNYLNLECSNIKNIIDAFLLEGDYYNVKSYFLKRTLKNLLNILSKSDYDLSKILENNIKIGKSQYIIIYLLNDLLKTNNGLLKANEIEKLLKKTYEEIYESLINMELINNPHLPDILYDLRNNQKEQLEKFKNKLLEDPKMFLEYVCKLSDLQINKYSRHMKNKNIMIMFPPEIYKNTLKDYIKNNNIDISNSIIEEYVS